MLPQDQLSDDDLFAPLQDVISGAPLSPKPQQINDLVYLKKAPNPVEFIESTDFLNAPELFPVQYETICKFFECWCPHCTDIENLQPAKGVPQEEYREIRKTHVLFEHDKCPKCGITKADIREELRYYRELVLCLGMRSGKSAFAALASAWILHEYLCIDKIQTRLKIVSKQALEMTFCAASGKQSTDTTYGQLRSVMETSPWFVDLKNQLISVEKNDPRYRRESLYRESDTVIWYRFCNIKVQAMPTSAATAAGRTRIFTCIDELSRLNSTSSKISANEVFRVLNNSLITVRSAVKHLRENNEWDVPESRMFVVSSPLFATDKTMELVKHAENNIHGKAFGLKLPTWDVNPFISREDLDEDYYRDPVGAKRDFGAEPPESENPFIEEPRLIDLCIDSGRQQMFTPKEIFFNQVIQGTTFNYVKIDPGVIRFRNMLSYTIHIDPGLRSDSFCLGIGHYEEQTGNVIVDGCIEVKPDKSKNLQVHFPSVLEFLKKLCQQVHIRLISYDAWNSANEIQELLGIGVMAIEKNINRDDYMKFRQSIVTGKIRFPLLEKANYNHRTDRNVPIATAIYQLKKLNDDGNRVEHPTGEHDDMIQCCVGVHRNLVDPATVMTDRASKNIQDIKRAQSMRDNSKRPAVGRIFRFRGPQPKE
jgi:hypothetical protein